MSAAPFDMLRFFDADRDDDLKVIEVAGDDGEWITVPAPFSPDATFLVVLFQRGVRHLAVSYEDRVAEFDLRQVIVRDGSPIGVERNA